MSDYGRDPEFGVSIEPLADTPDRAALIDCKRRRRKEA